MNRRSFLSLLAAAFASPLIGQLDPFVPSTGQPAGWCDRCQRVHGPFDEDAIQQMYILPAVQAIAADVEKRAAEYAYGVVYGRTD